MTPIQLPNLPFLKWQCLFLQIPEGQCPASLFRQIADIIHKHLLVPVYLGSGRTALWHKLNALLHQARAFFGADVDKLEIFRRCVSGFCTDFGTEANLCSAPSFNLKRWLRESVTQDNPKLLRHSEFTDDAMSFSASRADRHTSTPEVADNEDDAELDPEGAQHLLQMFFPFAIFIPGPEVRPTCCGNLIPNRTYGHKRLTSYRNCVGWGAWGWRWGGVGQI